MFTEAPGLLCIIYFIDTYRGHKVPNGQMHGSHLIKTNLVLVEEKSQHTNN